MPGEILCGFIASIPCYRDFKPGFELAVRKQVSGQNEIKYRPKFAERIFNRRACKGEINARLYFFNRPCGDCTMVFYMLCLVKETIRKLETSYISISFLINHRRLPRIGIVHVLYNLILSLCVPATTTTFIRV